MDPYKKPYIMPIYVPALVPRFSPPLPLKHQEDVCRVENVGFRLECLELRVQG